MYKLIAIIGQSGSGKDTIFQNLLKMNHELHSTIQHTTRPPREGEVEGVDYYFIDKNCFADRLLNDELVEVACFNDWFYYVNNIWCFTNTTFKENKSWSENKCLC